MRNILTYKEYSKIHEVLSNKMTENHVTRTQASDVINQNMPKPDNYQSRLLKLIPTEVVAVYVFINGLIANDMGTNYEILRWAVFGVLFIINPFYLRYVTNVTNLKQIIICTIGFAVWAFSLGNNQLNWGSDKEFMGILGSVALALYTLIIPIFLDETPESKTCTPKQLQAIQRNPNLRAMYRGNRIDVRARQLIKNSPVLSPLKSNYTRGADFVDPVTGNWWDMTTPSSWLSHVNKYGFGGTLLRTQ